MQKGFRNVEDSHKPYLKMFLKQQIMGFNQASTNYAIFGQQPKYIVVNILLYL